MSRPPIIWSSLACVTLSLTVVVSCVTVVPAAVSPTEQAPGATPSGLPLGSPTVTSNWPILLVPGPECPPLLQDPEAVATDLYSLVQNKQDVGELLAQLMPCLGVPLLSSETDDATIGAFLNGRYPGVFDFELEAIAAGLTDGVLVDLDSLVEDLSDQGLVVSGSGEPLTRAAIDAGLSRIAGPGDEMSVVPRLLIALGNERAERGRTYRADPTWGDASLDPLQFLLLTLGLPAVDRVTTGAAGPQGIASAALALAGQPLLGSIRNVPHGPSVAQGVDAGGAVDWIALIMDKGVNVAFPGMLDSQKLSVCSMAWAGNARVSLEASRFVWHVNGKQPDTTELTGRLTFAKLYGARVSAILGLAGCPPPPTGGIGGKTVAWYPSSAAQEHGSLISSELVTSESGSVKASYQTVRETAPEDQQIPENEQGAGVEVTLQVLDLLTAFPKTLMAQRAIFGTAEPFGDSLSPSDTVLFGVSWYEPRRYTAVLEVDIRIVPTKLLATMDVHGTIELQALSLPDPTTGEMKLSGVKEGELTWRTTPGPLVNCGRTVVSGDGTIRAFVLSGAIGATAADARIELLFEPRPQTDLWTIPNCDSARGSEHTMFNTWLGFFMASHWDDLTPGAGIDIIGWSFTAADPTTGVIVGQRTYAEQCADLLCTGESTFKLILTPVK